MMDDITLRLRKGLHNPEAIILAGVTHDQRCLIAADEIEKLRDALQAMRGVFDTPIARRKHGGEYANEARKLAREAMTSPITLKDPHNG
jgi:hypothetical protein